MMVYTTGGLLLCALFLFADAQMDEDELYRLAEPCWDKHLPNSDPKDLSTLEGKCDEVPKFLKCTFVAVGMNTITTEVRGQIEEYVMNFGVEPPCPIDGDALWDELDQERLSDNVPPTITCPADITVKAGPGNAPTAVTWPPPTATDNSDYDVTVSSSPYQPGHHFPVGTSSVTLTATDFAGNIGSCSLVIIVTENPSCGDGYYKDNSGNCVDTNECNTGAHNCSSYEECVNTEGSFKCQCEAGYMRDPDNNHNCISEDDDDDDDDNTASLTQAPHLLVVVLSVFAVVFISKHLN